MRSVIISMLFGIFATTAVAREPMQYNDLDHFQVDCSLKKEQIQFLQSLRPTGNEKLTARFKQHFMPWQAVTDGSKFKKNNKIGTGGYDWLINQHLYTLKTQC
jgi:hypothetical protein